MWFNFVYDISPFDSLNKNNIFEKAIELSNLLGNEEKTSN